MPFPYFCAPYCHILSDRGQGGDWVPFHLWPEQRRVAGLLQENRLVVVLKARQLGLTWLVLAFGLWLMLFYPVATVLLFSRRDEEATDLLAVRLRGLYDRLPDFLKVSGFTTDNDHEWALANGSRALAFPTTAGDSYTARLAIVDEADLCPDLDRLIQAVQPTIDADGRDTTWPSLIWACPVAMDSAWPAVCVLLPAPASLSSPILPMTSPTSGPKPKQRGSTPTWSSRATWSACCVGLIHNATMADEWALAWRLPFTGSVVSPRLPQATPATQTWPMRVQG